MDLCGTPRMHPRGAWLPAIAVAASLVVTAALGQTPQVAWQRSVAGTGNASSLPGAGDPGLAKRALAVDAAGNAYVTGYTYNGAGNDVLTVKYGPSGQILWRAKSAGSSGPGDLGYAVAVDGAGNVAVTGASHNNQNWDILTIKYDAAGNEIWRRGFNGAANGDDQGYDIAIADNGDVVVTGSTYVSSARSNFNYVTIRYRSDGTTRWTRFLDGDGSGTDFPASLSLDADGDVVVTGYSTNAAAPSNTDYTTVKYAASNGAEQWRASMGGVFNGNDGALATVVDANYNVFVTGTSQGAANRDIVTVKYDRDGNALQSASWNGTANRNDFGHGLVLDGAGNVYVAGLADQDFGASSSPANPAFVVIKYDNNLVLQWARLLNGSGSGQDFAGGLAVDASGNVLATAWADPGSGNVLAIHKLNPLGDPVPGWPLSVAGATKETGAAFVAVKSTPGGGALAAGLKSNGSDYDFLIVKAESGGTLSWTSDEGLATDLATVLASGVHSHGAFAVDGIGNTVLAGKVGDGTRSNFFVAKVDPAGNTLWRQNVNGAANGLDQAYSVAADATGNIVVAGDSYSGGFSDFLTVKLDAAGNELWRAVANVPNSTQDVARAVAVDSAGDVIVTGTTNVAGLPFPGDFLTVKYAGSSGAKLWQRQYNGSGDGADRPSVIAVDAARNIYVSGRSYDGFLDGVFTIKYDENGLDQPGWGQGLPSAGTSRFVNAIDVDGAGNVFIGGNVAHRYDALASGMPLSSLDFAVWAMAATGDGGVVAAGSQGLVARIGANGAEAWRTAIDGVTNPTVTVTSLAIDAMGATYAVSRNSADPAQGYTVVKLDAAGAEQWKLVLPTGGSGMNAVPVLKLGANAAVHVAGNATLAGARTAATAWKITQQAGPPQLLRAVPGNAQATFFFDPPASDGGSPFTSFTVSCNGGIASTSGPASSLTLGGLVNDTPYSCIVSASNYYGASAASNTLVVTPSATAPPALVGAVSRRLHGGVARDLDIDFLRPIGGAISVEPRSAAGLVLVLSFSTAVNAFGVAEVLDAADAAIPGTNAGALAGPLANQVTVTANGAPLNQRFKVKLRAVNGTLDVAVPLAILPGDVNGSRKVGAADIAAIKARSSQAAGPANFRLDVDASGTINAADISQAKARAGQSLPP